MSEPGSGGLPTPEGAAPGDAGPLRSRPSVLQLASRELRRFRGGRRSAALAALMLVPTLLAAVYLWANWNPLGHLNRLPVALVDQDQPTQAGGQSVAGGVAVTQTLGAAPLLGWQKVDAARAQEGLEDGKFFGVLTIPPDFSARLGSPVGDDPERAFVSLRLDDANGYLAGVAIGTLGIQLQDQIDAAAQQAYADAAFAGYDILTKGFGVAADDAAALAKEAEQTGASAQELSTSLGDLEGGARDLKVGTGELSASIDGLAEGLQDSSDAVQAAADKLKDLVAGGAAGTTPATTPDDAGADENQDDDGATGTTPQAAVDAAVAGLKASAGKARDNVDDIKKDASKNADDAAELRTAAATANGDGEALADDTGDVATQASELADQLRTSTDELPTGDDDSREELASVLVHPVDVNVSTANAAGAYGRGLAPLFLSIGLWAFALLVFLVMRPVADDELEGEASSLSLALGAWLPAALVGAGGAVVLFLAGFPLGLDPELPLSALALLVVGVAAFTAVVQALRLLLGRAGLALALVLLVVQIAACGGVYPAELAPGVLRAISPLLPFTWLADAFRVVISGGVTVNVTQALLGLVVLLVVAVAASTAAVSRRRRQRPATPVVVPTIVQG